MAETVRVIGIDPGSLRTGYAVLDLAGGGILHVDNGVIEPPGKGALCRRLVFIFERLMEVLEQFQPGEAAIEEIFYARNVKSAIHLGEARGVAMLALARSGREVFEYSATAVKQAVTGFGRAEKGQVAAMTARLLGLPEQAAADAADALAVAICHANTRRFRERLAGSKITGGRGYAR